MISVKIAKRSLDISALGWLVNNLPRETYGFNKHCMDPDYKFFEFLFLHEEDAIMFAMIYKK